MGTSFSIVSEVREFERKISSAGQFHMPPAFRHWDSFYIVEPGVEYPADELRYYPSEHPPVHDGPLDGEQLKVSLTEQGQVTVPARFLEISEIERESTVYVSAVENEGYIVVRTTPRFPEEV